MSERGVHAPALEQSNCLPYRPPTPNEHWLAGEAARAFGVPRDWCPLAYRGSQWEWKAGWDYEEAKSRSVSQSDTTEAQH